MPAIRRKTTHSTRLGMNIRVGHMNGTLCIAPLMKLSYCVLDLVRRVLALGGSLGWAHSHGKGGEGGG